MILNIHSFITAYLTPGSEASIRTESGKQDRNISYPQRAFSLAEKTSYSHIAQNDSCPGQAGAGWQEIILPNSECCATYHL